MLTLFNLSVKAKLGVLCFTFIAGLMLFGIVSYTAIESFRIGGERYQALSQLPELDDEIEMPIATSIPTTLWMLRMLLADNADEVKKDVAHFGETEKTFQEHRRLASMVTEIRSNSSALSTSAQELSDASRQLEAASQQTASGASAANAAAMQFNDSVQTVSNATGELTDTITAIAHSAADATTVASTAERLAASTHTTMTKLSESSIQIGNAIKVITSC